MSNASDHQLIIAKRRKARHYAMQALYQWQMAAASLNHIEAEFRTDNDFNKVDIEYFSQILHEVPAQVSEIDALISLGLTDRTIAEINPVEHALLRMAVFELQKRIDTPYRVVINEAVILAKKFGAQDSHKFINAVLDKVAQTARTIETAQQKKI